MRFNTVVYLVSYTSTKNRLGNPLKADQVYRRIFAEEKSVRQSEFYQAAATGLKPEKTFVTWKREYKGEKELTHNDKTYSIIRTFEKNDKEIELVCSGVVNRGTSKVRN